jgi:4-cresol dehydrogenase (hydroxylating)
MTILTDCCAAWADAIGQAHVETGVDALARFARSTFAWNARPLAILSPANTSQVRDCLMIADRFKVPVYPSSRGRSWGLGGRMPVRDAAVLDLSRMTTIREIDLVNGTAHIEPGVTFDQLQAALMREGLAYHVPSFGGPRDASVLANALERGEAMGAFGDRFSGLGDIEIVLASGARFHTGHARYGDNASTRLHARPAGPLLEGLFSQSGFGVAVSGRLTLAPTFPYAATVLAEIGEDGDLPAAVSALRTLVIGGLVDPYSIAIWDGSKRLSSLIAARAATAGMRDDIAKVGWGASIFLTGPDELVFRAHYDYVCRVLTGHVKSLNVHTDRDEQGRREQTPMTGFSDGRNVRSCYAGKPSDVSATGIELTKATDADLNPERDGCGFLWVCPVLPFDGKAIMDVSRLVANAGHHAGTFAALGMQAASRNALHGYVSFAWDRDEAGADERAMACHEEVVAALAGQGYLPYRLAHPGIVNCPDVQDDWTTVTARLRHALDPNDILAPGRVPGL